MRALVGVAQPLHRRNAVKHTQSESQRRQQRAPPDRAIEGRRSERQALTHVQAHQIALDLPRQCDGQHARTDVNACPAVPLLRQHFATQTRAAANCKIRNLSRSHESQCAHCRGCGTGDSAAAAARWRAPTCAFESRSCASCKTKKTRRV